MSNTDNIAAVLDAAGARLKIITRPIPTPGPNEIVVRNRAVAVNPVDWKMQDYGFAVKGYPVVLGSDSCGVITALGPSVSKFKVGDRVGLLRIIGKQFVKSVLTPMLIEVTGFAGVIYKQNIDHGAWQTYTVLRDIATTKIPDSMSFEEGSVFPMAIATSAIAIFACLGIPRPTGSITTKSSGLLVWGAASSVGTAAVQLAKNSGFKVFATASPAHHQYLKTLGAFEVFDYHDASVIDKIVASAKVADTPIGFAVDAVGEGRTSLQSAEVLLSSGGKGGELVSVLGWPEQTAKPEGIELSQTGALRAFTEHAELGEWLFNDYLEKALKDGTIVPAPKIEVVPGGIEVAQAVFDKSKAGVSGKKLIVKVDL